MFGALIGNPFDVVLIRRQATISTGAIPDRNTYQAFRRIIFEEGICSLWTGLKITMLRVVLINIGQLAIRDIIGT